VIGSVSGRQASIELPVRPPNQPTLALEFVVDTGFEGFLTLPPAAVASLQLPFIRTLAANLANDSNVAADVHEAVIVWHGEELTVDVLSLGRRPLLGTSLLDGSEMGIQFADGGLVSIDPL
jgi:clan AA aspartic protease